MSKLTPEALRLARMIEHYNAGVGSQRIVEDYQQAADELRRLYFENEKFRASLAEQPADQQAARAQIEKDTALLRQALDALNHVNVQDRVQIIAALRARVHH